MANASVEVLLTANANDFVTNVNTATQGLRNFKNQLKEVDVKAHLLGGLLIGLGGAILLFLKKSIDTFEELAGNDVIIEQNIALDESFKSLQTTIGEDLEPAVSFLKDAFKLLLDGFNELPEPVRKLIEVFALLATGAAIAAGANIIFGTTLTALYAILLPLIAPFALLFGLLTGIALIADRMNKDRVFDQIGEDLKKAGEDARKGDIVGVILDLQKAILDLQVGIGKASAGIVIDFLHWLDGILGGALTKIGDWAKGLAKMIADNIAAGAGNWVANSILGLFPAWLRDLLQGGTGLGGGHFLGNPPQGQFGIPSIPDTGMFLLHKGEQVIPPRSFQSATPFLGGGGGNNVVVNVTGNQIGNMDMVDSLAAQISRRVYSEMRRATFYGV